MRVLVLEENDRVTKLYKKIFQQKKINVEFLKDEAEYAQRSSEYYDLIILENPKFEFRFLDKNHSKNKVIYLSSFFNENSEISNVAKETREMLEKPFAMITLLSKLEIERLKKEIFV